MQMTVDEQMQIAREQSIEFPDKPVWVYQYGPKMFGFRVAEEHASESGLLIGIFYRGEEMSPIQAREMEGQYDAR